MPTPTTKRACSVDWWQVRAEELPLVVFPQSSTGEKNVRVGSWKFSGGKTTAQVVKFLLLVQLQLWQGISICHQNWRGVSA